MSRLKAAVLYYFKPQLRKTANNLKTPQNRKPKVADITQQGDGRNKLAEFAENLSASVLKTALPHLDLNLSTETRLPDSPNGLVKLADEILEKVMADVSAIYRQNRELQFFHCLFCCYSFFLET